MKRISRKFSIILLVSILLIFIAVPLLILLTPNKISDFYYKELTYKHIASVNTQNSNDDLTSLLSLFNYVKNNLNIDPAYKSFDSTAYNNLVLGICWCDQQAFTLATLLNKCNINSRLRDVQNHTTLEVLVNGEWKLIDPYFGDLFYRKSDGQLATLDDVIKDQGESLLSNKFEANMLHLEFASETFAPSSLYVPSEVRWPNGIGPEFSKTSKESRIRNIISIVADLSYDVLGYKYACWYQNHYLKNVKVTDLGPDVVIDYTNLYSINDKSFKHYFDARNYQLYGQNEKAQKEYKTLVSLYPDSFWAKWVIEKNYIKEEALQ